MTKFIDVSSEDTKEEKKETKFTHKLGDNGWNFTDKNTSMFEIVKYLGNCTLDGDMFATIDNEGYIDIFKGIKGSEFDN